jgi:hypothetical protein
LRSSPSTRYRYTDWWWWCQWSAVLELTVCDGLLLIEHIITSVPLAGAAITRRKEGYVVVFLFCSVQVHASAAQEEGKMEEGVLCALLAWAKLS